MTHGQHRVFRLLLDEGAVSPDVVDDILQWHPTGFDAYIGHEIDGEDKQALEYLAEYMAKGPISLEKLNYAEDTGKTRYRSTKAHPRHGAYRDFDPRRFLADLTVHIARPYERITNYHGRFSNRSRGFRRKRSADSYPGKPEGESPSPNPASSRKASWAPPALTLRRASRLPTGLSAVASAKADLHLWRPIASDRLD